MPFLPNEFNCNLYTLIRLYNLAFGDKETITKLVKLKRHDEILYILELKDESFELSIRKTCILELEKLLDKFIKCLIDWEH
jgi:hypothetical protein